MAYNFSPDSKKSLFNWVMSGVITSEGYQKVINTGKVPRGRERTMMIPYSQLVAWKLVKEE